MNKYRYLFFSMAIFGFFLTSFSVKKDRTKLLARQWIMTGMEVNGKAISDEMMERQQRGMVAILDFKANGKYNVRISTGKGRMIKRNKWRFEDKQQKLVMITKEGGKETEQKFNIEKMTSKKMILSMKDRTAKQYFIYKAYKPKKRRR